MRMLCTGWAAATLLLACPVSATSSGTRERSIEERVDEYVANLPDPFNGTILLAIGERVLLNKGYGLANRSFGVPNTERTKYQLASVSKDFTTVLTFVLAEKGLIELDATIDTYLPDYPEDKASEITIHHLLLHQSGIGHHFRTIPDYFGHHDLLYHTPREYLELFWDRDLVHPPGAGTTYTSPGYFVLASVLEAATGESFAELLEEHICQPLGMRDTHVENNLTARENLAVGYKKGIDGLVCDLREEPSNLLGAGDMTSTTGDLYRFQRALTPNGSAILSKEYSEKLFEVQYRINQYYVRTYAATLALTPYNWGADTLRVYGIGAGGNYGFQSRLTRLLDQDACYVVLSNVHNDRAMKEPLYQFLQDLLCEELEIPLRTHEPLLLPGRSPTVDVPEERLRAYEGVYRLDADHFAQVAVRDGKLCWREYSRSVWGRHETYGGELIALDARTFFDRNGWNVQRVLFVRPTELPATGELSGLRPLLVASPDAESIHLVELGRGGARVGRPFAAPTGLSTELAEYEGAYYSVEKQRTSWLVETECGLIATRFLDREEIRLSPLMKDLMCCEHGFLVFERYDDGTIRGFRLMSEHLDHVYGSLFVRK